MKNLIFPALITLALTSAAQAEGSLIDLPVTLQVVTYDTPDEMIFESETASAVISNEREFHIGAGPAQNKLNVIPFIMDITQNRIELTYTVPSPGELFDARFNGYVLDFASACPSLNSARVDADYTDLGLSNKRVRVDGNRLTINVSGMTYMPSGKIGVDIQVADCAGPLQSSGKKSN